MKLFINNVLKFVFITALLSTLISGCKKIGDIDPFIPERIFTPSGISVTSGETSAIISWNASVFSANQNDVTYRVELFTNNSFSGTPAFTSDVDSNGLLLTDADIAVRTSYWVRVKANATALSQASQGWASSTSSFSLTGEQLFMPLNQDYVTDKSVLFKLKSSDGLTHISLTPSGGTSVEYPLSTNDLTALEKLIEGLTPSTAYTAELYKATASKGILTFTTKSASPTGPSVVQVTANDNLALLLETAAPNTTFILEQGSVHTADNEIILPPNASFTIWGEYGPNKPVLAFNGMRLPFNAETIRFENVIFSGYKENDPTQTKRNYIFNQTLAASVGTIHFEKCEIRHLTNTPLRLQGTEAKEINNVIINDCIIYDIGNNGANGTYALIHTNVASGKFNNITISNSTLYDIGYSVILHNASPSQSIRIENTTINNSVGNARYLIDYNTQAVSSIAIENVIIGKSLSPDATARGIRNAGAAPTVSNTFQTSDTKYAGNPVPNITSYTNASTDLFTNPSTGNFLIKDASFVGKSSSGDPRWRL